MSRENRQTREGSRNQTKISLTCPVRRRTTPVGTSDGDHKVCARGRRGRGGRGGQSEVGKTERDSGGGRISS